MVIRLKITHKWVYNDYYDWYNLLQVEAEGEAGGEGEAEGES